MKKKELSLYEKMNIMRAGVMGANDGILSVAGIVIGVAGATSNQYSIFIAGISGILAGTVSMAMGEYVSVNAQKDSQKRAIIEEKAALKLNYQKEFNFVKKRYLSQGISNDLAIKATEEMMSSNSLKTSVRERFGFDIDDVTSPYAAAIASMLAFPTGSLLPMLAILLLPKNINVFSTFIAVIIALSLTGYSAAKLGKANSKRGVLRNVISGMLTMIITYAIGRLIGGL